MAEASTLIPPEARAAIGQPLEELTGVVCKKEFQRWAAAVGDLNPLYFDEAFAKSHGHRDVVMPPQFLARVVNGVDFMHELRPDGIPATDVYDLPLPTRSMYAGEELHFYQYAYPGDELTARRRLLSLEDKRGRSGAFVLITWQTSYVNQRSELVAEVASRLIAR
jgi:acyl dehydratase